MMVDQSSTHIDRASPRNDAQAHRPTPARSVLGLPCHSRAGLKTLATRKLRFATLNVGSLTGRSRELADLLRRRRVHFAFLQEIRWRGSKSRDIGQGYKLMYTGSAGGRNGVAVVLCDEFRNDVLDVSRISDRIMVVKVLIEGTIVNLVSAYAPQSGCTDTDKTAFWNSVEDTLRRIPFSEQIVIGADLNGHVGTKCEEFDRVHGGFGYGRLNSGGEDILQTALASDLAVVNTFFQKRPDHLITYKSGPRQTQIDYLLIRRRDIGNVSNCKVIQGECLTSQHRVLVMDVRVVSRRPVAERCEPSIKWWTLKGKSQEFMVAAESADWSADGETTNELWSKYQKSILELGRKVLGMSKGGRRIDKDTGWWNSEVQEAVRDKKTCFRKWQHSNSVSDRVLYLEAKRRAKRAVAAARASQLAPLYDKLDSVEGQKLIYKLAKSRSRASRDVTKCVAIRDSDGVLLTSANSIKDRWGCHFRELSNTVHEYVPPPPLPANPGMIPPITAAEVARSLACMKNGKAVGHDGIPIETWKTMGTQGVFLLTELFNKILLTGRMPDAWRVNIITPIYKGKGSVQECGNYRGIKLMSHTMKLFERIIDQRLRQECSVSECQYGFRSGCSTMDPIFALRTLQEAYHSRNQPLHFAFLDLQRAFDSVPREIIWWALRSKAVPEAYIGIIQDMYANTGAVVKTTVGHSKPFPITVGVHQGSVLSPYLFCIVLDVLSAEIPDSPPWLMEYADDIALVSRLRQDLETRVNKWKGVLENGGLKLNVAKTEYLASCCSDPGTVNIGNEPVLRTEKFKYLGAVLHESGSIDCEVKSRISAAWAKWRELTAVTCDPKIPLKLKGLIYKSIIRPVMLYGSETWPALERHVRELHANEMKMLRWMCGVTRLDRVRNEHIRGSLGVRDIADKIQEARLRWFGHVLRRPQGYVGNRCLNLPVPGTRPRGRPKKRWIDVAESDARANGLRREDAHDRAKWSSKSRKADPGRRRD